MTISVTQSFYSPVHPCDCVQSVWRGRRVRKYFRAMYLKATAAAMRIQALARGVATRRYIAYHKVCSDCACVREHTRCHDSRPLAVAGDDVSSNPVPVRLPWHDGQVNRDVNQRALYIKEWVTLVCIHRRRAAARKHVRLHHLASKIQVRAYASQQ